MPGMKKGPELPGPSSKDLAVGQNAVALRHKFTVRFQDPIGGTRQRCVERVSDTREEFVAHIFVQNFF